MFRISSSLLAGCERHNGGFSSDRPERLGVRRGGCGVGRPRDPACVATPDGTQSADRRRLRRVLDPVRQRHGRGAGATGLGDRGLLPVHGDTRPPGTARRTPERLAGPPRPARPSLAHHRESTARRLGPSEGPGRAQRMVRGTRPRRAGAAAAVGALQHAELVEAAHACGCSGGASGTDRRPVVVRRPGRATRHRGLPPHGEGPAPHARAVPAQPPGPGGGRAPAGCRRPHARSERAVPPTARYAAGCAASSWRSSSSGRP